MLRGGPGHRGPTAGPPGAWVPPAEGHDQKDGGQHRGQGKIMTCLIIFAAELFDTLISQ